MSVVDLIAPQYLDAAAVIVPIALFYFIGRFGAWEEFIRPRPGDLPYRFGRVSRTVRVVSKDRMTFLLLSVLSAMFAAAFFLSMALLGVPFT